MKRAQVGLIVFVVACSGNGQLAQRVCGEGTVLRDNRCEAAASVTAYGVPVQLAADPEEACGTGTVFNEDTGQCQALFGELSCGPGTTNINGECVPPPGALPCAKGTMPKDGACVPDDQRFACGEGTALYMGACVAVTRVQVINESAAHLDVQVDGKLETVLPPRSATPYMLLRPSEALALPSVTNTVLIGDVTQPFLVGHDYVLIVTGLVAYAMAGQSQAAGARTLQAFRNAHDAIAFGYEGQGMRTLQPQQSLPDYETPPSEAAGLALGDGFYELTRLDATLTHLPISDGESLAAYGSNGGVPLVLTTSSPSLP